jgi:hypothetical protein
MYQEISMKAKMGVLFLVLFLAFTARSWATTLPDACGPDKVQFDVKTAKNQPAPTPPADGKAQIVFIEAMDKNLACWSCGTPSSRFGLDGEWVGATKGDSYFTVDVAPGEHHLCADWQSDFGSLKKKVGMADFTAEAGKTYYFEARVKIKEHDYGVGPDSTSEVDRDLSFSQVNDDEGKYRVKASPLATASAKH